MTWTIFAFCGLAGLAIAFAVSFVHNRRQRAKFVATLSPAERERLIGFEAVKGDWHEFQGLLHR